MNDAVPPLIFEWDGESMIPIQSRRADRYYVIGEAYMLAPVHSRSDASHRQEFAFVRDAWKTLPEGIAELYPTPEHLRKRSLIDCGFYDETIIDAGTSDAAERIAAFLRSQDDFLLVMVRGQIVVIRKAKSQSYRAMGKEMFQKSKTAILELISSMIGVSSAELERQQ